MTFTERCRLSTDCLPQAPYRLMLEALHSEMLAEIERAAGTALTQIAERFANEDDVPLYTKPQWQGLTDDEVHELTKNVVAFKSDVVAFIREAEAKLKEKNT